MNKLIKIIKKMIIGIGFGCFFFLLVTLFLEKTILVNRIDFLVVLVSSMVIGTYSTLFEIEQLDFLPAFCLHFILTLMTASLMTNYFIHFDNWSKILSFACTFLLIYVFIWCVLEIFKKREIEMVNRKLSSKK